MTEEEIKYWALRMQKAAIGDRNAKHQIRVMEKLLAYTNQPSLKSVIDDAANKGTLKNLFDIP